MGNATSCAPSIILCGGAGSRVVKVLCSSNGTLRMYTKVALKAGEVMLENPGNFVCHSSTLNVGQRIHGLSADEGLEKGQLYFLLPVDLLYSVLTQEEMTSLNSKADKALKQHNNNNNFVKIFPVFSDQYFRMFPSDQGHVKNTSTMILSGDSDHDHQHTCEGTAEENVERYSKQRSWKPALETIVETPPRRPL